MGRRGNPYDNVKAESFMKTLKVEAVYPMAFEAFADVVEHPPRFIDKIYNGRRLHSALGYLSPMQSEDQHARRVIKENAWSCPAKGANSIGGSGSVAERLMGHGLPAVIRVAVAANLSRDDEIRVAGTLADLGRIVARIGLDRPILIEVGRLFEERSSSNQPIDDRGALVTNASFGLR